MAVKCWAIWPAKINGSWAEINLRVARRREDLCHVAEALARASQDLDTSLQPKAVELINKFIRMLFLDSDVDHRPSSYGYYNPITGQAPFFRGIEDYQHSL